MLIITLYSLENNGFKMEISTLCLIFYKMHFPGFCHFFIRRAFRLTHSLGWEAVMPLCSNCSLGVFDA